MFVAGIRRLRLEGHDEQTPQGFEIAPDANFITRIVIGLFIVGAVLAVGVATYRAIVPAEVSELEKPHFLLVEEVFEEWRNRYDCPSMDSGIVALKPFLSDTALLPDDQVQTVTLPKAKIRPTIGDLALDRTIRLQNIRKKLCQ